MQTTLSTLRILVAEDDSLSFKMFAMMLEALGTPRPTRVIDGAQAVETLMLHPFDIVFMDNHMPRMDGVTATRAIRKLIPIDQQPCIIGLSGSSSNDDILRFSEAGVNHFLPKPFRMHELLEILTLGAGEAAGKTGQTTSMASI